MIEFAVVVAVLVGVAQIFKGLGVPKKYIPLVNLILGIICGLFVVGAEMTIAEQIIYGAMIGLSASGLYDQSKIVKK